jgi:hypothetical protein
VPEELEIPGKKRQAIELGAMVLLIVVFLTVSLIVQNPFAEGADPREAVGTILAAGLTLIMYSFLYRDNPLFKIAENLYVGVALGYGAVITWQQSLRPEVYEPLFSAVTRDALIDALLHRTVPIILGLLLLTRLSRKHAWLSRYAYALMIGWSAGLGIQVVTHTYILQQLYAAVAPFQDAVTQQTPEMEVFSQDWFLVVALPVFGAVVVMIGTVAVLFYFFFSIEHKRAGGVVSRVGIWFLMVSFGASFGYTVMARLSLLIGRVQFLLFDWLKLPR